MRASLEFTATLDEATCPEDPHELFADWYQLAQQADYAEATATCLATADAAGRPSARMVLLKGHSHEGFDFYTNYRSRKAAELESNPQAALVFYWDILHRQIRIEGRVIRLPEADSDRYFASRARGSQIGAIASQQSHPIDSRATLEARYKEIDQAHAESPIPRPDFWGGYRILTQRFEFWQGRPDRFHDRITYTKTGDSWQKRRLQP